MCTIIFSPRSRRLPLFPGKQNLPGSHQAAGQGHQAARAGAYIGFGQAAVRQGGADVGVIMGIARHDDIVAGGGHSARVRCRRRGTVVFQSDMMRPSKPHSPRATTVQRSRLLAACTPLIRL